MRLLFTSSECVPFVKTGGLADVIGALSQVLTKKGHDVRVVLPLYSSIPPCWREQMTHIVSFYVQLGWRQQYVGVMLLVFESVQFYFLDNEYYFKRSYIYGSGEDELERFAFYNRAVLDMLPHIGFWPDVLHAHDWQSGMIPALLRIQYNHLSAYEGIKTLFTIHNLQYQGIFNIKRVQDTLGLNDDLWTSDNLEYYGNANFIKAALVHADMITTVSPTYAMEIQSSYYGERLDGLLRSRQSDLMGILNGIDISEYNPETDPHIINRYSTQNLIGKQACKRALQSNLGLHVADDIPIISMITRLSNQKGLDLVDYVIDGIINEGVQFIVLGVGDSRYYNLFNWAANHYKGSVAARFTMDHVLAHQIYAGSDIFLMPSRFEPCGLSQLISLRYGTVPLVRETGGLKDTVLSYNEYSEEGNGFTFSNYNAHDMLHTIARAVHYYKTYKDIWRKLQIRGMNGDYSWKSSADKYIQAYEKLI